MGTVENVNGGEDLVEVLAFKAASGLPAVRLTVQGGADCDMGVDDARLLALRLWSAGKSASLGIHGHHVRYLLTPKADGEPEFSMGEDFARFGVESGDTAGGDPVVELIIRDTEKPSADPICIARTSPQVAARLATRLFAASFRAALMDPVDVPHIEQAPSDEDLHLMAAVADRANVAALKPLSGDAGSA